MIYHNLGQSLPTKPYYLFQSNLIIRLVFYIYPLKH
nr:MAG TPA: hypothetical protein [Caudoviricetes sp.]